MNSKTATMTDAQAIEALENTLRQEGYRFSIRDMLQICDVIKIAKRAIEPKQEQAKSVKPQAGQWWCDRNDQPVFIVGHDHEGDPVYLVDECSVPCIDFMTDFLSEHKHAPECTGFDWTPKPDEVWPKWYVREVPTLSFRRKLIAYSRCDNQNSGETFHIDGTSYKWSDNVPAGWTQVTESEALARIGNPQPATCASCSEPAIPGTAGCRKCTEYAIEATGCPTTPADDPDEFVEITNLDHHDRIGIDQWSRDKLKWFDRSSRHSDKSLGEWLQHNPQGGFRCRRKDLPPQPSEPRYQSEVTCSIASSQREQKQASVKRVPVQRTEEQVEAEKRDGFGCWESMREWDGDGFY